MNENGYTNEGLNAESNKRANKMVDEFWKTHARDQDGIMRPITSRYDDMHLSDKSFAEMASEQSEPLQTIDNVITSNQDTAIEADTDDGFNMKWDNLVIGDKVSDVDGHNVSINNATYNGLDVLAIVSGDDVLFVWIEAMPDTETENFEAIAIALYVRENGLNNPYDDGEKMFSQFVGMELYDPSYSIFGNTSKEIVNCLHSLREIGQTYFDAGYRLNYTHRSILGVSGAANEVPDNALWRKRESAGYIATSEAYRYQYLTKR